MILTTTPTIQGHNIETYYGIVTSEVIIGANVVKDFFASIHDFFGGRAGSYENVLVEASRNCNNEPQHWVPTLLSALTLTSKPSAKPAACLWCRLAEQLSRFRNNI